jgi:cobalt-zinc-cadmium efflux system protein
MNAHAHSHPPDAHAHDHGPHAHHDHGHHHGHSHAHAPADFNAAFAFGVGLNLLLVVAQLVGGFFAGSLALVADAGHNFADVLGLILAWWANGLRRTTPTVTRTYGLRGASILAAVVNATLLLVTMGGVGWEALVRLGHPQPVAGMPVIVIAAAGIVVNALSAFPFAKGRKDDINVRAAFQHLAADAAISLGVLVAGAIILTTGALWIDPVVSLVVVVLVVHGTWGLLRDSLNMALQAVPPGVDLRAIRDYLCGVPGVGDVHDLHVWAMSTTETALTVHLVTATAGAERDVLLDAVTTGLRGAFAIGHVTVQIESAKPIEMFFRGREAAAAGPGGSSGPSLDDGALR